VSGRLGLAKLVLMPVREAQPDGHTHELFVTAPTDARMRPDALSEAAPSTSKPVLARHRRSDWSRRGIGNTGGKTRMDDDVIPF